MVTFQEELLDEALGELRKTAHRTLFAKRMGALLPLAVFLAGGWILFARFVLELGRLDALWGLLIVPLAPVVAWVLAGRELPEDASLVAWLDKRAGGTGQVLTQYQLGDERWQRSAAAACRQHHATDNLPQPAFQTAFWGTLPAGLFVAIALWFSPPAPGPALPTGLFDRTLEALAERVKELDAAELLEKAATEELIERLEEIAASLDEGGLEQAFEALDRFQEDLADLAEEHADELAGLREAALSASEGMSDELAAALAEALGDPKTKKLLKTAAEKLKSGGALDSDALKKLEELGELGDLGALGELSPAALEALGGAFSEELAKKLAEMARAGLIDQSALERALARRAEPRSLKDLEFRHAPDCASRSGGL